VRRWRRSPPLLMALDASSAGGTVGSTCRELPIPDMAALDRLLLDSRSRLKLLPAAELRRIPPAELSAWCMLRARYGIPSVELVQVLREVIGARSAIEIGAGMGDLGRHLGIPTTDSAIQTTPTVRAYYGWFHHPIVNPPRAVERLDARAAIDKYRPQVVLASWVTQLYQPGDEGPPLVGSARFGVDELELLTKVETYVHVGNEAVHGDKRACLHLHRVVSGPYLFSRATEPDQNAIYIWGPIARELTDRSLPVIGT